MLMALIRDIVLATCIFRICGSSCTPNPCKNGGQCIVNSQNSAGFSCNCVNTGYTDVLCDRQEGECDKNNPCNSRGRCVQGSSGPSGDRCICDDGYIGESCQNDEPEPNNDDDAQAAETSDDDDDSGMLPVIGAGGAAAVIIIGGTIAFVVHRRKKSKAAKQQQQMGDVRESAECGRRKPKSSEHGEYVKCEHNGKSGEHGRQSDGHGRQPDEHG